MDEHIRTVNRCKALHPSNTPFPFLGRMLYVYGICLEANSPRGEGADTVGKWLNRRQEHSITV